MLIRIALLFATSLWSYGYAARPAAAAGAQTPSAARATERPQRSAVPEWLSPRRGTLVRVDNAPWYDSDEPEAALTASADSLRRDFSADGTRPDDVVYEPVGVRAQIVRIEPGRLALLRGTGRRWTAYAPLDRLVPDVPGGTRLVVAGGFGGFADFYPTLETPEDAAERIATGTRVVVLGSAVAPADPGTANRLRAFVRVLSDAMRGRTGFLEIPYTGLHQQTIARSASTAERACSCRLISFGAH